MPTWDVVVVNGTAERKLVVDAPTLSHLNEIVQEKMRVFGFKRNDWKILSCRTERLAVSIAGSVAPARSGRDEPGRPAPEQGGHLGFTGTRHGMTTTQKTMVEYLLQQLLPTCVHHGDCIGADVDFHNLALAFGHVSIHIHPPTDTKARAWRQGHFVHVPRAYLKRNHDIVDACRVLIATPVEATEQLRSGTWATWRYANKQGIATYLVLPDGTIKAGGGNDGRCSERT